MDLMRASYNGQRVTLAALRLSFGRSPQRSTHLPGRPLLSMMAHMMTTVDIADNLLLRSKQVSQGRGVTVQKRTSEGLLCALVRRSATPTTRITPVTFKGKGLAPEFKQASWGKIRDTALCLSHEIPAILVGRQGLCRFPLLKLTKRLAR